MTKNIHLGRSLQQCCSKQDKHCKIIYIVIGCTLGLFLLWLTALSVIKSRKGEMGLRGPPGLRGPEGAAGPMGKTNDEEMKNEKIFIITKDTDFSTSTKVKPQTGFILENGVNSDVTITLPHFSVVGNGAVFHIFNQSPVYTLSVEAAKVPGQKPAQMSFSSGAKSLTLPPRQFVTIVIMAQQYVLFTEEEKNNKPILHWVNSWTNCGGIPKKFVKIPSDEGFIVGPSLKTWGCKNYRKGMDVVQINSIVKNANTLGKNPLDVRPGGIFVVENPNNKPIHNLNSQKGVTINSKGPLNIESKGRVAMNLSRDRRIDASVPTIMKIKNVGLTDKEAQCYLNRYSDLRKAFGANNIKAAKKHWLSNGIREKRTYACPNEKVRMLGGIQIGGAKKPKKKSGMLGGFKIGGNNTAKKKVGMLGLVKEKKNKKEYGFVKIGNSNRRRKYVQAPYRIKKVLATSKQKQKWVLWRDAKRRCTVGAWRRDKNAGWGENIIVKVEYQLKDGKKIKNSKKTCSWKYKV